MEETDTTLTSISSNTKKQLAPLMALLKKPSCQNLSNHAVIRLSGPDAETFLQNQITSDIHEVSQTKAQPSAICTNKGRVLATFILIKHQTDYLLIFPNNNTTAVLEQLEKFGHFSKLDIEIDRVFTEKIGVFATEHTIINADIPPPSQNFDVYQNDQIILIKIPGILNRYMLLGTTAQAIQQAIAVDQCHKISFNAWSALNIIDGFATVETPTATHTPHMLNLIRLGAVSFDKGCYIGQEVVARTEHLGKVKRLCMPAISTDKPLLVPSEAIQDAAGQQGIVINSVQVTEALQLLFVLIPKPDSDATTNYFGQSQQKIQILS